MRARDGGNGDEEHTKQEKKWKKKETSWLRRLIVKSIISDIKSWVGKTKKFIFLIGFSVPSHSLSPSPAVKHSTPLCLWCFSRWNLKCECVRMPLMLMCFFSIPFITYIHFLRLMFLLILQPLISLSFTHPLTLSVCVYFQVNFLWWKKYLCAYHWQHSAEKKNIIQRRPQTQVYKHSRERELREDWKRRKEKNIFVKLKRVESVHDCLSVCLDVFSSYIIVSFLSVYVSILWIAQRVEQQNSTIHNNSYNGNKSEAKEENNYTFN